MHVVFVISRKHGPDRSCFAAPIIWGIYVAVGVFWYGLNPGGAIAVLVCVGMFLGIWLLLLRTQKRDKDKEE